MNANATPQTMTISGKNKLALEDVLVGEVWLCSGQSNMEWSVAQSDNPNEEIANGNHPLILPSRVFGRNAPSKRITVGMIGCGRWGSKINLDPFLAMNDVTVVAVCDVDSWRMEFTRQKINSMKTITSAIIAMCALAGALRAEREFSVFDNAFSDIKSAEDQAALLKKLGYDGICIRPQNANDAFFAAMDRHGIKISAIYVTLPAEADGPQLPPDLAEHLRKLKDRKTIVWLGITNENAGDEATVSTIRKVCDLAAANGLEVVLYPHVGFKTHTSAECERLRKLADRPNLGISFNLCHYLCQDDPAGMEAALKAAAPHLKLVQISGADEIPPGKPDWQRLIQPLGQGSFDMLRVLRTLDQIGYKGPVNLQCYQINQPASQHLSASIGAWKKLNQDLTKP